VEGYLFQGRIFSTERFANKRQALDLGDRVCVPRFPPTGIEIPVSRCIYGARLLWILFTAADSAARVVADNVALE